MVCCFFPFSIYCCCYKYDKWIKETNRTHSSHISNTSRDLQLEEIGKTKRQSQISKMESNRNEMLMRAPPPPHLLFPQSAHICIISHILFFGGFSHGFSFAFCWIWSVFDSRANCLVFGLTALLWSTICCAVIAIARFSLSLSDKHAHVVNSSINISKSWIMVIFCTFFFLLHYCVLFFPLPPSLSALTLFIYSLSYNIEIC